MKKNVIYNGRGINMFQKIGLKLAHNQLCLPLSWKWTLNDHSWKTDTHVKWTANCSCMCFREFSKKSASVAVACEFSGEWGVSNMRTHRCTDVGGIKAKLRTVSRAISLAQIQETEASQLAWINAAKFDSYHLYSHCVMPCCHSKKDQEHFSACLLIHL